MSRLTSRLTRLLRGSPSPGVFRGPHLHVPGRARPPLRLAVIGTPRSGNTWLRRVVATAYDLTGEAGWERAIHEPGDVDWGADPARSIVQLHWHRGGGFEAMIAGHGTRAIVPRRHPFDVLVSILQYATHVHDTHRWLEGEGGDEVAIRGLHPNHPTFLDYATGPRAGALLSVSPEWRRAPGAVSLRYEDLVARPVETLDRLARKLGQPPVIPWESALEANTMDQLRKTHGFGHIWKGRPGLWKLLLTADSAARLAEAHRPLLKSLGERADYDRTLTAEQAFEHWRSLN